MNDLTVEELQAVWDNLDNASGSLYNAFDTIQGKADSFPEGIVETSNAVDISAIDSIKQEIEVMINSKKEG